MNATAAAKRVGARRVVIPGPLVLGLGPYPDFAPAEEEGGTD